MAYEQTDVSMVALKAHLGYGYSGKAESLLVNEGDTFTTTAARAERLVAKGVAAPASAGKPAQEPVRAPVKADPAPAKVDGRTKAGKADRHK